MAPRPLSSAAVEVSWLTDLYKEVEQHHSDDDPVDVEGALGDPRVGVEISSTTEVVLNRIVR